MIYNQKMCLGDNAKTWTSLSDINCKDISANSYVDVDIEENAFATFVTFLYIKDSTRIITSADGIYVNQNVNMEITKKPVDVSKKLMVIGKDGNEWLIQISNNSSYKVNIEYNKKMCFGSDAKKWKNLKDVSSFELSAYSCRIVRIAENGFAGYIVTRYTDIYGNKKIVYAHNLSKDGGISIIEV